ncbi:MAG TPA: hypothetical protein G4O03_06440 [Dehalococcoidia bacterium]|nr:hypothetical protein [Dehalococcoidia bacterium]
MANRYKRWRWQAFGNGVLVGCGGALIFCGVLVWFLIGPFAEGVARGYGVAVPPEVAQLRWLPLGLTVLGIALLAAGVGAEVYHRGKGQGQF